MTHKCDHCGKPIDLENDIDCAEFKMFESRNLCKRAETKDFHRVDTGKLYFCGDCKCELLTYWVHGYGRKPKGKDGENNG